MSKVNSGQVGRFNDLVVLTEQTPLAIVNAENDIVAATYQSCPCLFERPRVGRDVQVQQIQSTATDVNSTLSEYNLQGLGSSICAIRLVISIHDSL